MYASFGDSMISVTLHRVLTWQGNLCQGWLTGCPCHLLTHSELRRKSNPRELFSGGSRRPLSGCRCLVLSALALVLLDSEQAPTRSTENACSRFAMKNLGPLLMCWPRDVGAT